jgi:hypothetical protein
MVSTRRAPFADAGVGERGAWASTSTGAPKTMLATTTIVASTRSKPIE